VCVHRFVLFKDAAKLDAHESRDDSRQSGEQSFRIGRHHPERGLRIESDRDATSARKSMRREYIQ
jgi:hypothetical protein